MNRVFDLNAILLQEIRHLTKGVLRLRNRHAIARNDDDLGRVLHHEGRVFGRALLDRASLLGARGPGDLAAPTAEDDGNE